MVSIEDVNLLLRGFVENESELRVVVRSLEMTFSG
jgi:hypothetical protein